MVISIFKQLVTVFLPLNKTTSCSVPAAQQQKFGVILGTYLEVFSKSLKVNSPFTEWKML